MKEGPAESSLNMELRGCHTATLLYVPEPRACSLQNDDFLSVISKSFPTPFWQLFLILHRSLKALVIHFPPTKYDKSTGLLLIRLKSVLLPKGHNKCKIISMCTTCRAQLWEVILRFCFPKALPVSGVSSLFWQGSARKFRRCASWDPGMALPSCGQNKFPGLRWGQRANKTSLPAQSTEFPSRVCLSAKVRDALERFLYRVKSWTNLPLRPLPIKL